MLLGFRFNAYDLGLRVGGLGFRACDLGLRVEG